MILDFNQLANLPLPPVVIIGSGPAGLTLAQALDARGIGTLLLEAGEDTYTGEAQDLYKGEVIGDPYYELDQARLMMFGGSGNHWAGYCRPLDAHDFIQRDDIPHTGWPITKADLDPYAARTDTVLGLPPTATQNISDDLNEISFAFSETLSFADAYFAFLNNSNSCFMSMRSRVAHVEMVQDRRIRLHLRETGGDGAMILEPKLVVTATGGIENSRLLSWSNAIAQQPIIENPAALGRYWMEHPHVEAGVARAEDYISEFDNTGSYSVRAFFAPTYDAMTRFGILNGAARLRSKVFDENDSKLERRAKELSCRLQESDDTLASILTEPSPCTSRVTVTAEQSPDPENKIELSPDQRDAHGVPHTVLRWRKTEIDRRTVKVMFELLGRHLISTGQGLARAERWTIDGLDQPDDIEPGGYHHMGGTRMGRDASTSVVDSDLKVHGTSNFYVAGSSVFPTAGHANPTYTIIQLSLRLADHLAGKL